MRRAPTLVRGHTGAEREAVTAKGLAGAGRGRDTQRSRALVKGHAGREWERDTARLCPAFFVLGGWAPQTPGQTPRQTPRLTRRTYGY